MSYDQLIDLFYKSGKITTDFRFIGKIKTFLLYETLFVQTKKRNGGFASGPFGIARILVRMICTNNNFKIMCYQK